MSAVQLLAVIFAPSGFAVAVVALIAQIMHARGPAHSPSVPPAPDPGATAGNAPQEPGGGTGGR